jgi:ribulose-5-phosphate 4-epimerase/fuculose-1-phosphate aldolase
MMGERNADPLEELREKVALACRILALIGVVGEITGHVSARVPGADEMLLRCRGDDEDGVAYTETTAVRRLRFDGSGEGLGARYERPIELPIHGEILRARPAVGAVVHAHPPAVLLCTLAGVELRPVFGAFDPSAMALAVGGIPVYPRSILISSPAIAADLLTVMGNKDVCIMRGHGIAVAGRTVEEATLRAIRLEKLARVCWQLAQHGPLPELPAEDLAAFSNATGGRPALSRGDEWTWRYYVQRLAESGTASNRSVLDPLGG